MFGSCVNNLVFKELVINNTLGHLEERNKVNRQIGQSASNKCKSTPF